MSRQASSPPTSPTLVTTLSEPAIPPSLVPSHHKKTNSIGASQTNAPLHTISPALRRSPSSMLQTLISSTSRTPETAEKLANTHAPPTSDSPHERHKLDSLQVLPNRAALIPIFACIAYSGCSMLMTLSNKFILTTYAFDFPLLLLIFQNLFTLLLILVCRFFGWLQVEELKLSLISKWLPVNILFVLMLITGQLSLSLLSVPMVTIFKNFTTIAITLGDRYFFKREITPLISFSLLLMLFGSVVAGFNDLEFDIAGYLWMSLNCMVQAAYVLYMRAAMKSTKLSEFGMVYYNNCLSLLTLAPLLAFSGELGRFSERFPTGLPPALLLLVNGVIGFGISLTSFWAVNTTSPTTYSVVGSLNKIPLTILGVILFATQLTTLGTASIVIGLAGGVVYSVAKSLQQQPLPRQPSFMFLAARSQLSDVNDDNVATAQRAESQLLLPLAVPESK